MEKQRIAGILMVLALAACSGSGGGDGPFALTFEAPDGTGFVGGELRGVGGDPVTVLDFELRDGEAVSGTVTDGAGTPLAGVEVAFVAQGGTMPLDVATTDGAGSYAVTVAAGTWRVALDTQVQALGTVEMTDVVVASGGGTQDFGLPSTFTLTGTVTETFGPGIAGATLDFRGLLTGAEVSVTADPTGAYSAVLIPDDYEIVVTPAGGSALTHLKQRFPTNVLAGAGTLDFALLEGATVTGTVLDDLGSPLLQVADVDAVLDAAGDFFAPPSVQTNPADGTYTLGPLPPGPVDFEVLAPGTSGFPLQRITQTLAGPGAIAGVDQLLQAGMVLTGTISQDDGFTPEPNALLRLLPLGGGLAPAPITTDLLGDYAVSVFTGDYDLTVLPEVANLQLPRELADLDLSAAGIQDVTLALGSLVQGTVLEPDGLTPAPDVFVQITGELGASATTDPTGFYQFIAPPGTHDLLLAAQDGAFEDVALDPLAGVNAVAGLVTPADVTLALATAGPEVISGIVFEPDGLTLAANVTVTAHDADGDVVGKTTTSGAGTYVLVIQQDP
jgi:hypothetical protein